MKKNNLSFFLFISVLVVVLVACSDKDSKEADSAEDTKNLNESGMPIVKDEISLDFFAGRASTSAEDWNDVMIFNEYEKMSNIDVKWEMVPKEGLEEKRNLALASGTLPDVFYTAGMPNNDLIKYGEQGSFLELNDLINEYMPNLSKLLQEYPEIRKGITFPNGNIYSLPTIYDPEFSSLQVGSKLWIREDWLSHLGMDMPETTEEFYTYLKAVKETDLNGNSEADEIPFGGTSVDGLRQWLTGAFGVATRGRTHGFTDMDPETNEMRFYPIADGYKEMLQYMNKLFSEGLIQNNIYTIETTQSYANGAEGLYGSTVQSSTETAYGDEAGKKFIGMPALEGPNGDRIFTKVGSPLSNMGGFVVTNKNKHPAATLKWMDYFYSDEGTKLFFMGIEGETYKETEDGKIEYLDELTNNPEGLTFAEALSKYLTWSGGGYPGIVKHDFFKGAESLPSSIEAMKEIEPYIIDKVWPKFTYTVDENKEMSALAADIEKYVNEMQDKFITGTESFSEWDKYVKTIKDMGLEEYMNIQKSALKRYENE